jgi:flagellar basal-body rod modification protein FlgD
MSAVQNTTSNAVSDSLLATMNPTKSVTTDSTSETEDRFMKLLVAQMKNQDPLNPLDNAQVTSQMAQLSTVTGVSKLNTTLESLQANMLSGQSLEAANMIGHGVLVEGSSIDLASSKAILGVDLSSDASSVKLTVKDSTGKAVYTMNLGAQKAGVLPLAWDGSTDSGTTAVDGKYTFEVTAAKGDQAVTVSPLSFGEVTSVSSGTSGLSLNVPSIGSVKLSEIRQIL